VRRFHIEREDVEPSLVCCFQIDGSPPLGVETSVSVLSWSAFSDDPGRTSSSH
jgi:hypothetical protein